MVLGVSDMMYLKIFFYYIDKQKFFFYFKFSFCYSVSILSGDFESFFIFVYLIEMNMVILEIDI